jgi:Holliday junction resolvase RusA-like endonuclease
MKLTILGKLPTANEYIAANNRNRYISAKLKQEATHLVARQCKGVKPIKGLCDYTFTWHVPNKRSDPDNISFGQKFIFDGLQLAGVIENDSMKFVSSICHFFVIGEPAVEIEINES